MKKALLLLLIVCLTCWTVSALADVDYSGEWILSQIVFQDVLESPDELGMSMTMTLYEDGSAESLTNGDYGYGFWYYSDGKLFIDEEEMILNADGSIAVVLGDVRYTFTRLASGLQLDSDGIWRYYESGRFVEKTGIVDFGGGQFFVANGVLCSDANGLAEYDGQWYFLSAGQIQTQYTGLAEYAGHWFYVTNGLFDPNLNGMVDYDGSKFIVAAGERIYGINGLWQNVDGTWYYFADGQAATYYTGLTQYDYEWFYVIDGRLATEFTGTVEYDGEQFPVVNGSVVFPVF